MRRPMLWQGPAAVLLVAGMLSLGGAPATAAGDPVDELGKTVKKTTEKTLDPVTKPLRKATSKAAAGSKARTSTPSSDPGEPSSRSGTNDVEDPQAPDHGAADTVKSKIAGEDALGAGHTRSTVEDDDSTKAEATPLTAAGADMFGLGATADSEGQQHQTNEPVSPATGPVCEGSSGGLCLDVLYAQADATDDGDTSSSHSESELAGGCVGGEDTAIGTSTDCDSPVQAGLVQSQSDATRDQSSGRTRASSSSAVLAICLSAPGSGLPVPEVPEIPELPVIALPGGDGVGCAIEGALLTSQGESDSGAGGTAPSSSRSSSVGTLGANGEEYELSDPQALELPPGVCPDGLGSLLCGYVNQGETYLGDELAGHAQEALHVTVLPGLLDLDLTGARTETLVHNDGGEPEVKGVEDEDPDASNPGNARPAAEVEGVEARAEGGLPNTGGPAAGLLVMGLLGVGAGAMLVAVSRLRRVVI